MTGGPVGLVSDIGGCSLVIRPFIRVVAFELAKVLVHHIERGVARCRSPSVVTISFGLGKMAGADKVVHDKLFDIRVYLFTAPKGP